MLLVLSLYVCKGLECVGDTTEHVELSLSEQAGATLLARHFQFGHDFPPVALAVEDFEIS